MDIDIFDALNYLTGSLKTGPRLKLCDFNTITDFLNFNDKSIDKIEEYIQLRCSIMNEEQRAFYLDEGDIKNPLAFMISPGLRNRLLKAVAIILQSINNGSFSMRSFGNFIGSKFIDKSGPEMENSNMFNFKSIKSPNIQKNISEQSSLDFQKNIHVKISKASTNSKLNNINVLSKPLQVTKTSLTLRKMNQQNYGDNNIPITPKGKKTLNVTKYKIKEKSFKSDITKSGKIHNSKFKDKKLDSKITETIIKNCYESIAANQFLNFENCNLIPKIDFDIEIKFNGKSIGNSKCFYICCQCNNKRVKFSFNKDLKPIQTGIKSHNRTHFSTKSSFISTQFRNSSDF